MEERRLRIGSLFEWVVAAVGVLLVGWLISVPVERVLGPQAAAAVDGPATLPPGVPSGATNVPVILMLDGREIRHGELHTRLEQRFPKLAKAPAIYRSDGQFGDRWTRKYDVDGSTFYVVCERLEPGGPVRVSGIYVE